LAYQFAQAPLELLRARREARTTVIKHEARQGRIVSSAGLTVI